MQTIKRILKIIIISIIIMTSFMFVQVQATTLAEPLDTQYLELRAKDVIKLADGTTQVIMELWGNNVEFKGFDVRFSYDNTKVVPSNILTNQTTNDIKEYFKFENEFASSLQMFTREYDGEGSGIRAVVSFKPPVTESEPGHIINKDAIGMVVNTNGGVLLGKMSFKMLEDVFDASWFSLVSSQTNSPKTGIKINLDETNFFENQSTFRFTDQTASKDAYLKELVLSNKIKDKQQDPDPDYKEYGLTPQFNKETLDYEVTLLEYIDKMFIKVEQNDAKSTMKIKVPKRDEQNALVYEADGKTIVYEEKVIQDNTPLEFTLNKLGEPDTIITVIVKAEDGITKNEYEVVIKRPYGTIKGSVQLGENLRQVAQNSYATYVEYIADIKFYKAGEFLWGDVTTGGTDYSVLDNIKLETKGESDKDTGEYEIYVIPQNYDVFIEKEGFTQCVHTNIGILENATIDLGLDILYEGDINRDGIVDIMDFTEELSNNGQDSTNPSGTYNEKYDFMKKGYVDIMDLNKVLASLTARKVLSIK